MTLAGARARAVEPVRITALRPSARVERPDQVVGEEPLEIRVAGPGATAEPVGVTMRTPGHDFELAVGFLLAEGLLADQREVRTVRYCDLGPGEEQRYNVVTVESVAAVAVGERGRASTVTASCGLCGTATLEQLQLRCDRLEEGPQIPASVLTALPDELRRRQRVFDQTGGLHAAGLFTAGGQLVQCREDVGRHNAVDKLVGWAALERRLPLSDLVLAVSGRVSYEIVQKAALARIPVVAAVSAPSSLAVTTARRLGMTLAGFVREGRANLYASPERVTEAPR